MQEAEPGTSLPVSLVNIQSLDLNVLEKKRKQKGPVLSSYSLLKLLTGFARAALIA
jgi:hypothetical protein